jgi:protein TonB
MELVMNKWISAIVAALAIIPFATLANEATSATVSLTWDVSLDVGGKVTTLATGDERVPKLHAQLEKAIRAWHFSPGKLNGEAAATQTHLTTTLEIRLVGDGAEVRVVRAETGARSRQSVPPKYPTSAARSGVQGQVVVLAQFDETGAVKDVARYDNAPAADERLARAAIASVKQWTFAPEVVGGHPVAGAALVPICFTLAGRTPPVCEWNDAAGGESMSGSEAVAVNPAAKLETDVVGHLL